MQARDLNFKPEIRFLGGPISFPGGMRHSQVNRLMGKLLVCLLAKCMQLLKMEQLTQHYTKTTLRL